MVTIWLIGVGLILFYRAYAFGGIKLTDLGSYDRSERIANFVGTTIATAFMWPLALPLYGMYFMGKKAKK